ncbi:MAG TPA: hypothetical protein VFU76_02675 [Terriglobales bacterium]|nr:hypothetical protein [Terriglobales bacterium]
MKRLAGIAMLLALAAVCGATTVIPLSVEQLTADADEVVEARAVRSWSAWNPQRTIIYTFTDFNVTSRLKGASPDVITVKQMGGHADGLIQTIAGLRYFQDGEEALLFLRRSAMNDGTRVIVGLMQGNFRVWTARTGHRMASNGVPHVNAVEGSQVRTYGGTSLELDAIEARVRKAVR